MMNGAYRQVIQATTDDRRALFLATANRLGTAVQQVEKDFWVCWTLDALFNGLPQEHPRLLFKGGTSLSKAYGLIERFSEDIDITVFRQDISQPTTIEELQSLSGKKRSARLDAIKKSSQAYIGGRLLKDLRDLVARDLTEADSASINPRVRLDDDDDQQSILIEYPTALTDASSYIRSVVKIEGGAKSALDPHQSRVVTPYLAREVPQLNFEVSGVTTVDPERTFWDKLIILHGLRRWFERRGELRQGGQRISRHYYDVFRLMNSEIARRAVNNRQLATDCALHAQLFFFRADLDLEHAVPGSLALVPPGEMKEPLRRDYAAMAGMIFGEVPPFDAVMETVARLELQLNG